MGQVRTHAFFDADSSATANKCTLGSKTVDLFKEWHIMFQDGAHPFQ